jgi:hypothetical protein
MNEVRERFGKWLKDSGVVINADVRLKEFLRQFDGLKFVPEGDPCNCTRCQARRVAALNDAQLQRRVFEQQHDKLVAHWAEKTEQLEKRVATLEERELKIDQIDNCLVDVIGRVAALEEKTGKLVGTDEFIP